MSRADYWNTDYFQYWQRRTIEANRGAGQSGLVEGDRTTVGDSIIEQQLALLEIRENQKVLDLGCGFGRLFPFLHQQTTQVYGSDISAAMIDEARRTFGTTVLDLRVEEAEKSSYPDSFFDRIVCWGVFDATDQAPAITEMIRLLRPGARVLLTGKNDYYESSDADALAAEKNARLKGHPNFFSNYSSLKEQLADRGLRTIEERFFIHRGDFSLGRFARECPDRFYEYLLVFETGDCVDRVAFTPFSSAWSRTWVELYGQQGNANRQTAREQ
jgi:SAM-dependent methyltransferase